MNNLSPLDSNTKEAGLRILKRAFSSYDSSDSTMNFNEVIKKEILKDRPDLINEPKAVNNIGRILASRFFEIVTNQNINPSKNKQKLILNQFISNSKT